MPLIKNALIFIALASLPASAADFLWLSDIHFDPLATPALVDKLTAAKPAQWADLLATGSTKFPAYGRDTSWPLFASVLQASTKTAPNAAFTIVTGDLLVHHFREQFNAIATNHDDAAFRAFVHKSVEFVALQLKQRAPGKPIYVTLGNNDDECGDYATQPDGPFLQDTARFVGDLAGLSNTDSYVHLGSYSVLNRAIKHQRIIVLNTVFFSPRYANRCGQSSGDVGEQLLAWLAKELDSAKAKHEKVWLVYHVPPGVDAFATTHAKVPGTVTLLWKESYVTKFANLLDQYPGVVGPNFAGHIHVDDFRLVGQHVVILAPAVSPITGQNPTFRTVSYDSHGNLKDQSTYYLKNLTEPWQLEYDFDKEWHLKAPNAQSYSTLFTQLANSTDTTARWLTLYSTSNVPSTLKRDAFRPLFCAEGNLTAQAYQTCAAPMETNHAKTTN